MTDEFISLHLWELPDDIFYNFINWTIYKHGKLSFEKVIATCLNEYLYCYAVHKGNMRITFKSPEHYTLFLLRFSEECHD